MKRFVVGLTLVLLVAGVATGWWWLRASLPVMDGQLTLSGLHAPVEVLFDSHGVPSVYARDPDDAWFAAGVMHARDRRWQMELYRRVTLGRLSEALGDATLAFDQRFLTLGLRDAARAEWARATPQVRSALERYAAGVNAATAEQVGRKKPIEFQLLGITPPPWEPIDSLAIGRLLAWRLAENHQAELVRGALAAKFGDAVALQLTGAYPSGAPTILPTQIARAATSSQRVPGTSVSGLEWLAAGARRGNSNNWVVAGARTASGKPILANDPHLPIEFPSVWYEMHVVAAGLDVIGATIPGVPFIALGHNARIAWGMTATGADVQDLAMERIDVGRQRSMFRGEWVPVEVTRSDIPVRGRSAPLPFEVWKTRNGPIFADTDLDWDAPPSWLSPEGRSGDERRAYSLRWDNAGDLAGAFEALNRATDWSTFTSAVSTFSAPSMNVVYADVDGNIGYALSGRIPVRAAGDGRVPVDGNAAPAWTGALSSENLPRSVNPASGVIYSANHEVDRTFSGLITKDWIAPFRATRLRDQLSSATAITLDAMSALQQDRHSVAADVILAGLASAMATGRTRPQEARSVELLEQLSSWDRVVDARPVVSLYEAFEHALWRRAFVDEMDEPLFRKFYEWAGAERPAGLHAIIGDRESRWWDDISTIERRETRDDIFLLAARDADEMLQNEFGGDSSRQWDRVHQAHFTHPLGAANVAIHWLFDRGPVPVEGDGTTVMRISWNRLAPFSAWEHPSWRQLFDVGEWDNSRVSLPTGQSGHPLSPSYFDQNPAWASGQVRPQPFSRNAVVAASRHRLLLVP